MKRHPLLILFIVFVVISFLVVGIAVIFFLSNVSATFNREPVVVVKIEGPIFESLEIMKELQELTENQHVKAVVLRLDSPGGAVSASQEIYEEVLKLKEHVKVVASMGTVAASGAYYIASAADKIVANSGTVTGSIGVIMESFGLQALIKKIEVEPRIIKSGQFKDVGTPFREMTEGDRVYLQQLIDDMYEQFLDAVSKGRKIPIEKIRTLAEGRVYTGLQAKKEGLVDVLGNIYTAIDLARTEAGLPKGAKVRWPSEPGPFEKFMGSDPSGSLAQTMFHKLLNARVPLWYLSVDDLPKYQLQ
ncbi:MAG: signal peptide peptidase SppA [Deltaproteobacteria bacterium]|nr:signal peptide peptidase SppA [Deltaproteobacteria bacterium]